MVFEARDETLDRRVAVQVLGPWLAGQPVAAARLESEARTLARLQHPGVVQVLGAGRAGDLLYFAMEYVDGRPLSRLLDETGPVPADRAMVVGRDVAGTLAAAHAAGIVHRDLKPMRGSVESAGGHVEKMIGDCCFAVFLADRPELSVGGPSTRACGCTGTCRRSAIASAVCSISASA